jgi:hypothetical protein
MAHDIKEFMKGAIQTTNEHDDQERIGELLRQGSRLFIVTEP